MGTVIKVIIWTSLISFFSLYISDFAYVFGMFVGIFQSALNFLSVVGVSCITIGKLTVLLSSVGLLFVAVRVYGLFRN